MARIYGVLRNATGVRANTKIILTATRTSTQVIILAPDRFVTTDAGGSYDIECNVCGYLVTIMQPGLPIEHVGNINVYADSADGTLESFLTDIREDELTPEVIKRVEEAAKLAELSAIKAEQAADNAADDAINNVMPVLDGKVTAATEQANIATEQANIAKDAAQEALHNASLTFISGGTFTPKSSAEYPNVVDVVRDTIWLISFPNRDDKYVYTTGALKGITVKSGDQLFYDTPQDGFKWLPSGAGGAVYSVNGKTGTSVNLSINDIDKFSNNVFSLLVSAYKSEVEPIGTIKPWMSNSNIPDGYDHLKPVTTAESDVATRWYFQDSYPEFYQFLIDAGNSASGVFDGRKYVELQLNKNGEVLRQTVDAAHGTVEPSAPWDLQGDAIRNITGEFAYNLRGSDGWGFSPAHTTGSFTSKVTGNENWAFGDSSDIIQWVGGKSSTVSFSAATQVPTATDNRMANRSVNYIIKVKHSAAYYALINAIV